MRKFEIIRFKFTVYGHKQASRHTHVLQCSPASVGLAQAPPQLTLGRETFFPKSKPSLHSLCLADSSGQAIDISSDEWMIGNFYEQNSYQPSRFKLYVMYKPSVSIYIAQPIKPTHYHTSTLFPQWSGNITMCATLLR